MMNSAPEVTRRSQKMRHTATHLTTVARRLTAERGLNGFTVEEVCDEVDISRRTFFNYFPSKEDAIIGVQPEEDLRRFSDEFLARGSGGWATVVDDLVELVIAHFESAGVHTAEHAQLMSALEREPKLLFKFMGVTRERDRQAMALVAQRENVAVDDPRAEAALNVLSILLRSTGEHYLLSENTHDFSTLLHERLAAMRAVLAPESPRKGNP
jgi:AcrR family transcriptional regulator